MRVWEPNLYFGDIFIKTLKTQKPLAGGPWDLFWVTQMVPMDIPKGPWRISAIKFFRWSKQQISAHNCLQVGRIPDKRWHGEGYWRVGRHQAGRSPDQAGGGGEQEVSITITVTITVQEQEQVAEEQRLQIQILVRCSGQVRAAAAHQVSVPFIDTIQYNIDRGQLLLCLTCVLCIQLNISIIIIIIGFIFTS